MTRDTSPPTRRRQFPAPISDRGLAALRVEVETYDSIPSRLVRRVLARLDVAEGRSPAPSASEGAESLAERSRP